MAKDKINETANAVSSRSRGGNKKEDKTKQQHGTARENDFLNALINKIGDVENVSISINGDKRIPIKDLKKKIN
jgi:hypothetical protein